MLDQELLERLRLQRMREQEALALVAVLPSERLELRRILDPSAASGGSVFYRG
jgi:hypothetical protein